MLAIGGSFLAPEHRISTSADHLIKNPSVNLAAELLSTRIKQSTKGKAVEGSPVLFCFTQAGVALSSGLNSVLSRLSFLVCGL